MTGSIAATPTLGALAKLFHAKGEQALRARVDRGAFLVGAHVADQVLFDTPSAGRPTPPANVTVVIERDADPDPRDTARPRPRPSRDLEPGDPSHLVLPLVKSDRNPFAGMLTIGRAKNNDLILPSSQVSKVHAWLSERDGRWHLRDKGSTNGTFVDCIRLDAGVECALAPGHTVRFAEVVCRFVTPDDLLELCSALPA